MDSPGPYQQAIHRAATADEVGEILKRFFASIGLHEGAFLDAEILSISTFSEGGLSRKAARTQQSALHVCALGAPVPPALDAARKILSTAALRVSVLNMDMRARRAGLRGWLARLWSRSTLRD